jgi:hypothetical protein
MQWLKNRIWTDQFYKITKEGDQLSIFDASPYEYILHIQNTDAIKYHFIKDNYEIKVPYRIFGMSVSIHEIDYNIPPNAFVVEDNELFSETLTLWLCKHYLSITPTPESYITVIDENMDIYTGSFIHIKKHLQNDIK